MLAKEVVKHDVHVMNGPDPLCAKGKSKNKHTQSLLILRFLGTMCSTSEQLSLFSGQNRDIIDTRKKADTEKRMNDVNVLVTSIGENVTSFINKQNLIGHRKKHYKNKPYMLMWNFKEGCWKRKFRRFSEGKLSSEAIISFLFILFFTCHTTETATRHCFNHLTNQETPHHTTPHHINCAPITT